MRQVFSYRGMILIVMVLYSKFYYRKRKIFVRCFFIAAPIDIQLYLYEREKDQHRSKVHCLIGYALKIVELLLQLFWSQKISLYIDIFSKINSVLLAHKNRETHIYIHVYIHIFLWQFYLFKLIFVSKNIIISWHILRHW